jgi:hypothetical protein
MRQISTWLKTRVETFFLLPEYGKATARQWMNILFGETVVGAIFLIWWAISNPKNPPLILIFVAAMLVAGYFAWRADHVRLMPKLAVQDVCIQETPTNTKERRVFVQILPKCLTDAPVRKCQGHLLRVYRQLGNDPAWELTEMNEPLDLEWSYYGNTPRDLQPKIDQRLNICFWSDKYDGKYNIMHPAVFPVPQLASSVFLHVGPFKFDVRITAEDCAPVDLAVVVAMTDSWNKPIVELKHES